MGVISQLEERQFYLEDLTGAVPIDLANAISLEPLPCYLHVNIKNNIHVSAVLKLEMFESSFVHLSMLMKRNPFILQVLVYSTNHIFISDPYVI
jgi:hypothetical protein